MQTGHVQSLTSPEHLTVKHYMLSPFTTDLIGPVNPWKPTQKLVPNLRNKTEYVCHYRNLQFYIKHGLILTKIHRILSFSQSPWLKPWIDLCTKQRKAARTEFESDLAKLQANATFGKTMEQVRHRVNIRLIADDNKFIKAVAKPSFRQSIIINNDLAMVRGNRQNIKLAKPIVVGFSIQYGSMLHSRLSFGWSWTALRPFDDISIHYDRNAGSHYFPSYLGLQ